MKQKRIILLFSFLFVIFFLNLVLAANDTNDSTDSSIEVDKGDSQRVKTLKGYECLNAKIKDKCSSLGVEDLIFSTFASGGCKSYLLENANNNECWPKSACDVKTTAQAVIGLTNLNANTDKAQEWVLKQIQAPRELTWYLQIDSNDETTCKITYDGSEKTITIGKDKKITSSAGACLTLSPEAYWLVINEACYSKEFAISCNQGFLTNLLYKKKTSPTIYVPETIQKASAEGTTRESVNSSCFKKGADCNYEASLWAALALNKNGEDIENFLPYLTAMSDSNEKFLPESFLYILTSYPDFYSQIVSRQKASKYWDESGNKFYDTALALLSLQDQTSTEKQNAIDWLLEVQGTDGCWNSNIRDTAFILYSEFPKTIEISPDEKDCEDNGKYCVPSTLRCREAGGEVSSDYSCFGVEVCCSKPEKEETCQDLGGITCTSSQVCNGDELPDTGDLSYGESCCKGKCEIKTTSEINECEDNKYGTCKSECSDDEEEFNADCTSSSQTCCTAKTTPERNWTWIIIISILIILAILGIIFRNKLRELLLRMKSRKGPPSFSAARSPRFPPSGSPFQRQVPRRIIPSQMPRQLTPQIRKPTQSSDEFSNVLKKLKEMSK